MLHPMPLSSRPEPQHTPATQATLRGPLRSAQGPSRAVHSPRDRAQMENMGTTEPCHGVAEFPGVDEGK